MTRNKWKNGKSKGREIDRGRKSIRKRKKTKGKVEVKEKRKEKEETIENMRKRKREAWEIIEQE